MFFLMLSILFGLDAFVFAGLLLVLPDDSGPFVMMGALALFSIIVTVGSLSLGSQRRKDSLRSSGFAQDNGFTYIPEAPKVVQYPGIIFGRDQGGVGEDLIAGSINGQAFEIFNYDYPKSKYSSKTWGVFTIQLRRHLPNIILDSQANNIAGMSNLADRGLHSNQKFELEGNFSKHFTVYAPEKYERDVLYFLTPELMALLVDQAATVDMEIVNDRLFFYTKPFRYKAKQLEEIMQLLQLVGGELSENITRYQDARMENKHSKFVSQKGRRLVRR